MQTEELIKIVGAIAPSVGKYLDEKLKDNKRVNVPEMNAILITKLIENNERLISIAEKQTIMLDNHIRHEEDVFREIGNCVRSMKDTLDFLGKKMV